MFSEFGRARFERRVLFLKIIACSVRKKKKRKRKNGNKKLGTRKLEGRRRETPKTNDRSSGSDVEL